MHIMKARCKSLSLCRPELSRAANKGKKRRHLRKGPSHGIIIHLHQITIGERTVNRAARRVLRASGSVSERTKGKNKKKTPILPVKYWFNNKQQQHEDKTSTLVQPQSQLSTERRRRRGSSWMGPHAAPN
jgi:hypothetical protein